MECDPREGLDDSESDDDDEVWHAPHSEVACPRLMPGFC